MRAVMTACTIATAPLCSATASQAADIQQSKDAKVFFAFGFVSLSSDISVRGHGDLTEPIFVVKITCSFLAFFSSSALANLIKHSFIMASSRALFSTSCLMNLATRMVKAGTLILRVQTVSTIWV